VLTGQAAHEAAVARLKASYDAIPAGLTVRLAKKTSNLFRPRAASDAPGLDVSGLGGVISIDVEARTADVQGMCTYEALVDATLPHGLIPYVVPQLRTITLGGAVSGLGIESTSFRSGLPHESVSEMDVFTGAGDVVTTKPGDDLFDTFPNSYGSLGYATRLRIALEKVPSYVSLRHVRFDDAGLLSKTIAQIMEDQGVRRRPRRRRGRHGVPAGGVLPDARRVDRPSADGIRQRLHRAADLLPLDPAARDGPADDVRLPVALGHRLVLVLARVRRPAPVGAGSGHAATSAPTSTTGWSPSTTASTSAPGSTVAGQPRGRARRAGRRDPGRAAREFLDWFDAEVGHAAGVAVPALRGQEVAHLPACSRARSTSTSASGATSPSARGAERTRNRAIEAKVHELDGTSRSTPRRSTTGDLRRAVRRRQPGAVKDRYDPDHRLTSLYDKAVRDDDLMRIADAFEQLIQGPCPCASRRTTAARADPRTRRSGSS
jgi:FAD/FMN-containing dehydrogenase